MRKLLAMTAATASLLWLAGCATSPAPTHTSTGDTIACVEESGQQLVDAQADVPLLAPTAPLDLDVLSGKTIWYVTVTFNQFSTDWVEGLKEAAAEADVNIITYDGQGSVNRFNEGISQAVAQRADGIIVAAIDPSVIEPALAQAEAAGIPVLNGVNSDPADPVPPGMYGNFTSDFTQGGANAANWVLADSDCKANLLIVTTTSVNVWENVATGAAHLIAERCSTCTVTTVDFDIANLVTDIGSKMQSALAKDPSITHVLAVGDSLVPFIDPVIVSAGSSAKVIGHDGLAASLDSIAADEGQHATIALPPFGWLGWLAFDDISREILGIETAKYTLPTRLLDASNIGDGSIEALFPEYADYQTAFLDAWSGE